ncbi:MAG: VCBS repeat-containing protein, partial [Verrucomicrobiales bacterium]|nr:VCBS repeat-containing protein [Verrucomicrobiales bacterium]
DLVTLNWRGDEGLPEARQRRPFSFSLLLGRGDGSFEEERRIDSGRTMAETGVLRVGDFTGDGRADLAVLVPDFHPGGYDNLNPDPAEVLIFRSTGAGAIAPPTETLIPFGRAFSAEREHFVIGHFDGDPHLDAIVNGFASLTGGQSELQGRVLVGRGDGTFESRISPLFGQRGREWRLVIADLNKDGLDDALFGTNVYRNLGNATFAAVEANGLSGMESSAFTSAALGHLDSDGFPDFVARTAFRVGNGLATFGGRGDGTFAPIQRLLEYGPNDLGPLGMTDLNADGFGDLILASGTASSAEDLPPGFLPLVAHAGRFPALVSTRDTAGLRLRLLSPSLGTGPAVADFDGDGRDDLIGFSNTGEFGLILSRADGFAPIRRFASPGGFFPYSQWPGDVDGDGHLDLVVGDQSGTPRTFYYRGDGSGGFDAPVEIPGDGKLLRFLDLDGDRRPDLVATVTRSGGASSGNYLVIRTNLGGGSFSAPIETRLVGVPRSVFPTQWDGDPLRDLAVDYGFGTGAAVLLQRSGGRFETGPSTGRQDAGFSLAGVADFDGDGLPDLLMRTTSSTNPRLQLWPGRTGGAFGTPYPVQSTSLAGAEALSIGDFNGDGAPDLLGRSFTADAEARIALGDGRGRFANAIRFDALPAQSTGGDAVLTGDFDGDGLPDLFVGGVVLPHKPR